MRRHEGLEEVGRGRPLRSVLVSPHVREPFVTDLVTVIEVDVDAVLGIFEDRRQLGRDRREPLLVLQVLLVLGGIDGDGHFYAVARCERRAIHKTIAKTSICSMSTPILSVIAPPKNARKPSCETT